MGRRDGTKVGTGATYVMLVFACLGRDTGRKRKGRNVDLSTSVRAWKRWSGSTWLTWCDMWLGLTSVGRETNTGRITNVGQLSEMKERMEKIRRKMERLEKTGKQQAGKVKVMDEYPHPETKEMLVPMRCMEHHDEKQAQTKKKSQSIPNPSRRINPGTSGQDTLALYHFFTQVAEQNAGDYTQATNKRQNEMDKQTYNQVVEQNISSGGVKASEQVNESNQNPHAGL